MCNDYKTIHALGMEQLDNIFAEILPAHGFTYREEQLALSKIVFEALLRKDIALCEAGVGSGKTLAYLTASIVYREVTGEQRPVILSTSTIALQKALTEQYLPQLSTILAQHHIINKPLRHVVRKGKTHYICDLRLGTHLAAVHGKKAYAKLIPMLMQLEKASKSKIDLSLYPLTRYLKDRICVTGRCPVKCPHSGTCRYQRFVASCMSDKYDVLIVNHNLAAVHIHQVATGGRDILPPYCGMVFDEAHKLLGAAQQIYGHELAETDVPDVVGMVSSKDIPENKSRLVVAAWADMLVERCRQLYASLLPNRGVLSADESRANVRIKPSDARSMGKMADELRHLVMLVRRHGNKKLQTLLPNIKARCDELCATLDYFREAGNLIIWIELDGARLRLCCIPEDMDKRLYNDLWRRSAPFLLTSGTMSVSGDFALMKRQLGICRVPQQRVKEKAIGSPFDYANNTLLYIPEGLPFPKKTEAGYVDAIAKQILRLVAATHGHTLLLFTSYWVMERVFNMVKETISAQYPLFILSKGRVDVLGRFRDSGNGVLFASDAAGEGVDLPGDILSSLVIVKLPFAVPDAISGHERSKYNSLREFQQAVVLPDMLIRLRQYVGRAIRLETDTAVISILDSRVACGGKFRRAVLEALPPARTTNRIDDVKAFIRKKKDDAYFYGEENGK